VTCIDILSKDKRPPEGSPKTICAFLIGYLGGIKPNLGAYALNPRLISHFRRKQEKIPAPEHSIVYFYG
jgi:hypothetical protein